MKKLFAVLMLLSALCAKAQHQHCTITGQVQNTSGEPISGAFVHWQDVNAGVFTDSAGHFALQHDHQAPFIVASFATYDNDTVEVKSETDTLLLVLRENNELALTTIIARRVTYGLSKISPRTTVLLNEREFQKAACCNLSESFENAPAIDVSFSDAVTGTKQIKMLGLDGFYTLIGREYMPSVRTLNSYYGLSHIPAAWVEGIQITKGAGSVVNGYESIAGQINIELKKAVWQKQVSTRPICKRRRPYGNRFYVCKRHK